MVCVMVDNETAALGARIRDRRLARGYTLQELAMRSGVTTSTLWRWETGKQEPRTRALQAIAEALRCDVLSLITDKDLG